MKRVCKKCGVEKEYNFLCLNTQGRSVYKDETDKIWHSKICYACHLKYVKDRSTDRHLAIISCPACQKEFKQKVIRQVACSRACYEIL